MRSSSYVMRTASRFYRGSRIKAIQLGYTWHLTVHSPNGSTAKSIESTTLADAMAQAEWFIEARFAFRPYPPEASARPGNLPARSGGAW
jgi:hypothetical protein